MYSDPLAYFITWTTYGTWLPGDERGWIQAGAGHQPPDLERNLKSAARMSERPLVLTAAQRQAVEAQIRETCAHRGWELHAVRARTNHIHAVVTSDRSPADARDQLKAWCTRPEVIDYVMERQ